MMSPIKVRESLSYKLVVSFISFMASLERLFKNSLFANLLYFSEEGFYLGPG